MASEETALALSHRHQILIQNDSNSGFRCNSSNQRSDCPAAGGTSNNNGKATRELTGFINHRHRYYQPEESSEFRQRVYNPVPIDHRGVQNWHGGNGKISDSLSGDGSDGDDDDVDDDEVEGLADCRHNKNNNSSNTSGYSSEKDGIVKFNHLSSLGSSRDTIKVGNLVPPENDLNDTKPSSSENHLQNSIHYPNAIALVDRDGELYYSALSSWD
ncbi:hypothetical protein R6Q59_019734 [Mikania micrantha]